MIIEKKYCSLDEIIFENRNKVYGAYYLRQIYDRRVLAALLTGTAAIVIFTAMFYVNSYLNKDRKINIPVNVGVTIGPYKPEPIQPPIQPPPKPPVKTIVFAPPAVATDPDEATVDNIPTGEGAVNTPVDTTVYAETPPVIEKYDVPETPPVWVQEMPVFANGVDALYKYLQDNIKYPPDARYAEIEGKVWVTFVVETDGSITGVKLKNDIGGGCGPEALRVIAGMPKWKPGRENGRAVRVQFNLPVTFTLQ